MRQHITKQFGCFKTVPPSAVENPDEPAQPIEELGEPLDGVQCKACSWITTNKDQMRMHCKKNHQQAWTGEKSLLYNTVKVQSFFRTRGLQKYFVVNLVDARNVRNDEVKNTV